MVAVFGAFALGDLLLVRMLGFALAVAVLLDATLVAPALGAGRACAWPGRWNWWPGETPPGRLQLQDVDELLDRAPPTS